MGGKRLSGQEHGSIECPLPYQVDQFGTIVDDGLASGVLRAARLLSVLQDELRKHASVRVFPGGQPGHRGPRQRRHRADPSRWSGHCGAETELDDDARKFLAFTDNRQDASLQAGHFNDFVLVGLVRSALYRAVHAQEQTASRRATHRGDSRACGCQGTRRRSDLLRSRRRKR